MCDGQREARLLCLSPPPPCFGPRAEAALGGAMTPHRPSGGGGAPPQAPSPPKSPLAPLHMDGGSRRAESIKQYYQQLCANYRMVSSQLALPNVPAQRKAILAEQLEKLQGALQDFTDRVIRPIIAANRGAAPPQRGGAPHAFEGAYLGHPAGGASEQGPSGGGVRGPQRRSATPPPSQHHGSAAGGGQPYYGQGSVPDRAPSAPARGARPPMAFSPSAGRSTNAQPSGGMASRALPQAQIGGSIASPVPMQTSSPFASGGGGLIFGHHANGSHQQQAHFLQRPGAHPGTHFGGHATGHGGGMSMSPLPSAPSSSAFQVVRTTKFPLRSPSAGPSPQAVAGNQGGHAMRSLDVQPSQPLPPPPPKAPQAGEALARSPRSADQQHFAKASISGRTALFLGQTSERPPTLLAGALPCALHDAFPPVVGAADDGRSVMVAPPSGRHEPFAWRKAPTLEGITEAICLGAPLGRLGEGAALPSDVRVILKEDARFALHAICDRYIEDVCRLLAESCVHRKRPGIGIRDVELAVGRCLLLPLATAALPYAAVPAAAAARGPSALTVSSRKATPHGARLAQLRKHLSTKQQAPNNG